MITRAFVTSGTARDGAMYLTLLGISVTADLATTSHSGGTQELLVTSYTECSTLFSPGRWLLLKVWHHNSSILPPQDVLIVGEVCL